MQTVLLSIEWTSSGYMLYYEQEGRIRQLLVERLTYTPISFDVVPRYLKALADYNAVLLGNGFLKPSVFVVKHGRVYLKRLGDVGLSGVSHIPNCVSVLDKHSVCDREISVLNIGDGVEKVDSDFIKNCYNLRVIEAPDTLCGYEKVFYRYAKEVRYFEGAW